MTLKKIDTNPIILGVARKNKKFRKYLEELKKKGSTIRKQPKLPGLKKGTGENGVVYSDKEGKTISKEEARKRFDRADAAERRERGMSKQKPYPPGMRGGGLKDAIRTIKSVKPTFGKDKTKAYLKKIKVKKLFPTDKNKKYNVGGNVKIKGVIGKLKKASKAHAQQVKTLQKVIKRNKGGMAYYEDIL
tara:strand:- start:744 stop:1310 length:567 start_codon:yes stop_codon:yes gene_type:complete